MAKPRKQTKPEEQVTAHPETQKAAQRLPEQQRPQSGSTHRDGRTGQDKDGNEEHPRAGRKAS
jgi:hypothetical protein